MRKTNASRAVDRLLEKRASMTTQDRQADMRRLAFGGKAHDLGETAKAIDAVRRAANERGPR